MKTHRIIYPSFVREDKRGIFIEALNKGHWKQISYGFMKKGAIMGNHYHRQTEVFFFIAKGSVEIHLTDIKTKKERTLALSKEQGIILKRNFSHIIRFLVTSAFIMCKSKKYTMSHPDTYILNPNVNKY